MFRQILILILILICSLCAFAQIEKYTAPIKWERYKISDKDISVLFPKLPILIQAGNNCSEEDTNQYAAYAGETVYGLTIVSKSKQKTSAFCSSVRKLDEKSFDNRLEELKNSLVNFDETKFNQNDFEVIKLDGKNTSQTYWLINDFKNKRWFEFWITGADKEKTEVKNFAESINISKNIQGIEIGKGASRTLGDENIVDANADASIEKSLKTSEKEEIQPLNVVLKPKPNYTDAARKAQIQGDVTLKITFLASGGVGSVTVVNALPFGLIEQAVAAASKMVFIPPKKNGVNYSVVKTVQYNFRIY